MGCSQLVNVMKSLDRFFATIFLSCLVAVPSEALPDSLADAGAQFLFRGKEETVFVEHLQLKVAGKVCRAAIDGYEDPFNEAFKVWEVEFNSRIEIGREKARKYLEDKGLGLSEFISDFDARLTAALESTDDGSRKSRCFLWLRKVLEIVN